jgi:YbgC/YbaW family acyl-CoA thioester hydrolase
LVFDQKLNYHKKNIRVLSGDIDAFGRLNWRAYVRYCEEGEAGLMEMLGFRVMHFYGEQKISFPRRAATFEYLSPVLPADLIDIETTVKKLGKTSFTLSHSFFKKNSEDGERILSAKAEVTAVAFNEQVHEKVKLPVELKEALRRILVSPE